MSRLSRGEAVEIINQLDEYRIRFENASDDAEESFSNLLNRPAIKELLNGVYIELPQTEPGVMAVKLTELTEKFFERHRKLLESHRWDDVKIPALRDIKFNLVSREWEVEIPRSSLRISTKDTLSNNRRAGLIRQAEEELWKRFEDEL